MIDYSTFPQSIKNGYERSGKREGITGEQYYIKRQKEKAIYKRSLFENKSRKEIQEYLSDVYGHLVDIADYLEIIDSPYAKEALMIEGDFLNFSCRFEVVGRSEKGVRWEWEEIDFCGRRIKK